MYVWSFLCGAICSYNKNPRHNDNHCSISFLTSRWTRKTRTPAPTTLLSGKVQALPSIRRNLAQFSFTITVQPCVVGRVQRTRSGLLFVGRGLFIALMLLQRPLTTAGFTFRFRQTFRFHPDPGRLRCRRWIHFSLNPSNVKLGPQILQSRPLQMEQSIKNERQTIRPLIWDGVSTIVLIKGDRIMDETLTEPPEGLIKYIRPQQAPPGRQSPAGVTSGCDDM